MLHPNAKNRLLSVAPTTIEASWIHPNRGEVTTTVEPDVRWKSQDRPIEYPVIAMELSPESAPQEAFGDRTTDTEIKVARPDDDTIAYERYIGTPMYAHLHITVGVDTSKEGIPAHMLADIIANEVFYEYEYNSDHLHEQGTTEAGEPIDYEWPMRVHMQEDVGVMNMNRMVDKQTVQRRLLEFYVEYHWWRYEEVPATKAMEIEFELVDPAEVQIAQYEQYIDLQDDEWLDS